MKVLVIYPGHRKGGVANYYQTLRDKFSNRVTLFPVGSRPGNRNVLATALHFGYDCWKFMILLKHNYFQVCHFNPSLDPRSLLRDFIFLMIARLYRQRIIIFFRGWDSRFAASATGPLRYLFRWYFNQADAIMVLADEITRTLKKWGIERPIYHEVTVVDDRLLNGFDFDNVLHDRCHEQMWSVLFLARIVLAKGIIETIQAVGRLQQKGYLIELHIAGEGPDLAEVRRFVNERNIPNIIFHGWVGGDAKVTLLQRAHLLCFPTSHGEGMPNAVAEAMGFGLPVVTRPVAGLADFFKNGVHGWATRSKDPEIFSDLIENLLVDNRHYREIAFNNYQHAQLHFLASDAAGRLERLYDAVGG